MFYAAYFSRAYTFLNNSLTDQEVRRCQEVLRIRGSEMYRHLTSKQHLWKPLNSHDNRIWHFMGEVGIALHGEVPEADEWTWFTANKFFNVYPVWSDSQGGWHEGISYLNAYLSFFSWWADVMRSNLEIDAFKKPFFSRAGDYVLYLVTPGTTSCGGFGDATEYISSSRIAPLMRVLARQTGNQHWYWYAIQPDRQVGDSGHGQGLTDCQFVEFLRSTLPPSKAKAPIELPISRCFRGTGQASLNTTLLHANENVQVVFKSSPFGTQSHGYESNNSFTLSAFGERLLIRSGTRDSHGSTHHRNWTWSTRSVNNVTVNGAGQIKHSAAPGAQGEIIDFYSGESVDIVIGEAGKSYVQKDARLNRFTRSIVFVKPDLVVVYDRLNAQQDSTFQYWLHSFSEFDVRGNDDIRLRLNDACCIIQMLTPAELRFSQTDKCDPEPKLEEKLNHWHLTAETTQKARDLEFVTLIRPYRQGHEPPNESRLEEIAGGYILHAKLTDGQTTMLLPTDDSATLRTTDGLTSTGCISVRRTASDGTVRETVRLEPKAEGENR